MTGVTFSASAPPAQMKPSAEFAFMNSSEPSHRSNGGTFSHQPASENAPMATQASPAVRAGRLECGTSCIAGSVTPGGQRAKQVLPPPQRPQLPGMKNPQGATP